MLGCARSSIGQSNGLRIRRLQVRVLPGAPFFCIFSCMELKTKIIITGLPRSGKTTLVRKLVSDFSSLKPAGFYSEEIVQGGRRTGFKLVDISTGSEETLAHISFKNAPRVGRYGVNLQGFENFLNLLELDQASLIFIDEIGKMECMSKKFIEIVKSILNSQKVVVATAGLKGEGFIKEVKTLKEAKVYLLDEAKREEVYSEVKRHLLALLR